MKLHRPRVPLAVRVVVAQRQLLAMAGILNGRFAAHLCNTARLKIMLHQIKALLNVDQVQLDHRPPLGLREFDKRTGKYSPDANDPRYLEYIGAEPHLERTAGRGGDKMRFGGDTRAIAKVRRIERTGKLRVTVGLKKRPRVTMAKNRKIKFKWPKRELRSRNDLRRTP